MITWRKLNNQLTLMTEKELSDMLAEELNTHKRASILLRLHQRINTLRMARERIEIMAMAVKP